MHCLLLYFYSCNHASWIWSIKRYLILDFKDEVFGMVVWNVWKEQYEKHIYTNLWNIRNITIKNKIQRLKWALVLCTCMYNQIYFLISFNIISSTNSFINLYTVQRKTTFTCNIEIKPKCILYNHGDSCSNFAENTLLCLNIVFISRVLEISWFRSNFLKDRYFFIRREECRVRSFVPNKSSNTTKSR